MSFDFNELEKIVTLQKERRQLQARIDEIHVELDENVSKVKLWLSENKFSILACAISFVCGVIVHGFFR